MAYLKYTVVIYYCHEKRNIVKLLKKYNQYQTRDGEINTLKTYSKKSIP